MGKKKDEKQDQKDLLLDFFLYAPIGLLYEFSDLFPEAVKRGKSQVEVGKVLGKMAAQTGKKNFESSTEEFVKETAAFFSIIGNRLEDLYSKDDSTKNEKSKEGKADKKSINGKTKKKSSEKANKVPLKGYDKLSASQVVKRLEGLTASERATVAKYEKANKARKSILKATATTNKKKK